MNIGHEILVTYLLWKHVSKLILWTLESKEWSDNKSTPKSKAYSKLLGHNHHDRKEQGECNENEEDPGRQKQTKIHKCFSGRKTTSGRLEVARYISHTFRNPKQLSEANCLATWGHILQAKLVSICVIESFCPKWFCARMHTSAQKDFRGNCTYPWSFLSAANYTVKQRSWWSITIISLLQSYKAEKNRKFCHIQLH